MDAVIYARLSQDQQGTEAGVERQLTECREYAAEKGWAVRHEYVDNDISATKGKVRPNFEALLVEVDPETPVVCWHTDRLVRVAKDLERVIDRGLFVYAKHAGHIDLSTPAGRATARTITAWATYEGEQKAERQKSAHIQRAKAGRPWWNRRPFGFNPDGTERPGEADAVRHLYRQVLVDGNLSELARWLNDRGFTTSAGKRWRGTGVRALLLGARNAGIATYHGEEVGPGNWEALVEEETYRAAVRLLGRERRFSGGSRGARAYLMTGFAICGECEATVRIWWRGGIETGYRVYGCPDGHASALGDWVDERAGAFIIARFAMDPEALSRMSSIDDGDANGIREEIDRLERKGEMYVSMLDDDLMAPDQFATVNRANRDKIAELRRELGKVGLSTALQGLLDVDDLAHHWTEVLTVGQQHAIVAEFYDRVVIQPRGRERARGMQTGDVEFWIKGEDSPRT